VTTGDQNVERVVSAIRQCVNPACEDTRVSRYRSHRAAQRENPALRSTESHQRDQAGAIPVSRCVLGFYNGGNRTYPAQLHGLPSSRVPLQIRPPSSGTWS
jgi:hypothetical protein